GLGGPIRRLGLRLLLALVHAGDDGRVRRRHRAWRARRAEFEHRRLLGLVAHATDAGRGHGRVHAVVARIPDRGWPGLHRQVVYPAGRAPVTRCAAGGIGDDDRAHVRDLRGILLARGPGHVHEATT